MRLDGVHQSPVCRSHTHDAPPCSLVHPTKQWRASSLVHCEEFAAVHRNTHHAHLSETGSKHTRMLRPCSQTEPLPRQWSFPTPKGHTPSPPCLTIPSAVDSACCTAAPLQQCSNIRTANRHVKLTRPDPYCDGSCGWLVSTKHASTLAFVSFLRYHCHGEANMAVHQLLVRQWYVVRHHIRRVHLCTVVHDPHFGGRRTTPRQMWPTTHGMAPSWWLLQLRVPGPTIVATHTTQHPHQQQLSPRGLCGALLEKSVRAVAVGSAVSKVRAASVVARVGLHQMKGTSHTAQNNIPNKSKS